MANQSPANAFTAREAIDPDLRAMARLLPRGYGLHRSLKLPRAVMSLAAKFASDPGKSVSSAARSAVTVSLRANPTGRR